MEKLEMLSFQIISSSGDSKAAYVSAIKLARESKFEEAKNQIKVGDEFLLKGHQLHAKLLHEEANGIDLNLNLLLVHAEDQLMNTESFKMTALEFIYLYERLAGVL